MVWFWLCLRYSAKFISFIAAMQRVRLNQYRLNTVHAIRVSYMHHEERFISFWTSYYLI